MAGGKKTFKSHVTSAMAVGVAGGVPVFGMFEGPIAMPVLVYVGEGGQSHWTYSFERLASAHGISDPSKLPVHPVFDKGTILDPDFQDGLTANPAEFRPGLVILDPLYAYHGIEVKAADLHQEGALLTPWGGPREAAGVALVIVNHFKQERRRARPRFHHASR